MFCALVNSLELVSWVDNGVNLEQRFLIDWRGECQDFTTAYRYPLIVTTSYQFHFWTNLLHSLIMWLIVSSLSLHNRHLLFCCVLSNLALIWLVLMVLFCVAIRRDSVSLLRFPFLSYVVHSISFETFFVQVFKILVDSWKFSILLLYILWDDLPIFMISGSNEQLQQQLEYTLRKQKRFKEGRESVRDDERCGRSKGVNTLELVGQRARARVTMMRF